MQEPVSNRYLEDNFAPVAFETTTQNLEVEGAIPPELSGTYLRNGPNPIEADPANHHWFVGEGMLHGVRIGNGGASWYRSRWVRTPQVAEHQGRQPVPADPGGVVAGPGNTNIVSHAGSLWALNELSLPYRIDDELGTVAQENFGGPMPNGMNAHPKFDPDTGAMHVLGYSFAEPYLLYHEISPEGALVRTEQIDLAGPAMVHETGLTDNWIVVFDLPVLFNSTMLEAGRRLPYAWDPEYVARVGLMPRSGTGADTVWVNVEPCFVFHTMNCYEDDGDVVMELVRHPSVFWREMDGPNDGRPALGRWRINPEARTFHSELLDRRPQEFPRIDERFTGRPYRYGFSVESSVPDLGGGMFRTNRVLRYDWRAGVVQGQDMGPGRTAGEFVFIPESDSAAEGEGWLMGFVYDAGRDQSDLVLLDATDIEAAPVAKIKLPARVPAGFHGNWVPDR